MDMGIETAVTDLHESQTGTKRLQEKILVEKEKMFGLKTQRKHEKTEKRLRIYFSLKIHTTADVKSWIILQYAFSRK